MRFLRNFLLLIILAYGLAYGYLWYETNNSLQRITQGAAFVQIDYASFFVSPLGNEITVDDISIVPKMATDNFHIDQLRLYADQPGFFLISGKAMQGGMLPERMELSLSNLQINLDGKFITMLEAMAEQSSEQSAQAGIPFANIGTLGCGDIKQFQLVDYRLMGIKRLNTDLVLNFTYNKTGEMFGIQIDANTRDIYDISMGTELKVPGGDIDGVSKTNSIPPMRMTINDTGFYKMRNAYCANANESSVEEYVDRHVQLLKSAVTALGIKLPDEITNAYQEHVLKGGRITLSIKPQEDIPPETLGYYKPLEMADLLGLKLSIGKTRIDMDKLFDADTSDAQVAQTPSKPGIGAPTKNKAKADTKADNKEKAVTRKAAEKNPVAKETAKKPNRDKSTYRIEKVENAHLHIGKMVEVTLAGNKIRRGLLEQVRNDRVYLLMELPAGTLNYPVQTSDIKRFKVLN